MMAMCNSCRLQPAVRASAVTFPNRKLKYLKNPSIAILLAMLTNRMARRCSGFLHVASSRET